MTQQPQAKYRHDYRAPDYLISDIDLTFEKKKKKKDPAASYLRRGKPNYCRRESA